MSKSETDYKKKLLESFLVSNQFEPKSQLTGLVNFLYGDMIKNDEDDILNQIASQFPTEDFATSLMSIIAGAIGFYSDIIRVGLDVKKEELQFITAEDVKRYHDYSKRHYFEEGFALKEVARLIGKKDENKSDFEKFLGDE